MSVFRYAASAFALSAAFASLTLTDDGICERSTGEPAPGVSVISTKSFVVSACDRTRLSRYTFPLKLVLLPMIPIVTSLSGLSVGVNPIVTVTFFNPSPISSASSSMVVSLFIIPSAKNLILLPLSFAG